MSLASYIVNLDELKEVIEEMLSNVVVKDIANLYGVQKVKGFYLPIPAIQGEFKVVEYIPDDDVIITGVTYSQSAYKGNDYWELWIDEDKLFENVYTKELGEQKHWEVINPVNAGSTIKVILNNQSGNSRHVWVDIEYVRLSDVIIPSPNP